MFYGVAPAVFSLLQLLIRGYYHPKLFVVIQFFWAVNWGSAIFASAFNFNRNSFILPKIIASMDIPCLLSLTVLLLTQGIAVGGTYSRLMKEEAAILSYSVSVFRSTMKV